VNTQVFGVKSRETRGHEAAKWREAVSHPSEKDRWKRSRDLMNLGVRRVKVQVFGITSREVASGERRTVIGSGTPEDH
jgi:hypothetical protein